MISYFYKYRKVVFVTMAVVLMAGVFVGLGSYYGGNSSAADIVARVGKITISTQDFYAQYQRQEQAFIERSNSAEIPEALRKAFQREILNQMLAGRVLEAEASEYGFITTDKELAIIVQSNFMHEGKFSEELYLRALAQEKLTPARFEAETRARISANKFRGLLTTASKVTPQELEMAYLASGKKDMKNFEKEKAEFLQNAVRAKASSLINACINSYVGKYGIQDFLDQREKGA